MPVSAQMAKRVVDLRFQADAGLMARNSIRDEEWVAGQIALADSGCTHDELTLALVRALTDEVG